MLHCGYETPGWLCNFLTDSGTIIVTSEFLTVTVMAIERYINVVHPLKYDKLITKYRTIDEHRLH